MIHAKPDLFETTPIERDNMRAIARRQVRVTIEHIAKPGAPQQTTVEAIDDAISEGITGDAKRIRYGDHALNWKQIKQAEAKLSVLDEMNCPKTAMQIEGLQLETPTA